MADNVVDAIAEVIEADGVVNARVWADDAPPKPTKPYITIADAISLAPEVKGDGRTLMLVRLVQVDLWEQLDEEDPAVVARLWAALDGTRIDLDGSTHTRLSVDSAARLPEVAENIGHRALTISVRHDPAVI